MKAVWLTGIRRLELGEAPMPKIEQPNDVLLKLEKVGVCGSDVHYFTDGRIGTMEVQFPFILGHECCATVVEVGSSVDRVKVGQAVAVDPAVSCYGCDQCLSGRENTCRKLKFLGCPGQLSGCLCEYMVMPQKSLYPTFDQLTLDQATMCEPLSIGVYAVKQAQLPPKASVAILGSGPIGLSALAAAQNEDVSKAFITDKIEDRLAVARDGGVFWAGNPQKEDVVEKILAQETGGMDAVFECAGQQETLDQAVEMLKPGGKLMMVGIPNIPRVSFVIENIRRKELTLINVRRQNGCVQPAIDMVASGKVKVDHMVTHHFPLEQCQQAFELVENYRDGVVKAIIDF